MSDIPDPQQQVLISQRADSRTRKWTYYLRPIWQGTAIGILLSALLFAICWTTGVRYTEISAGMDTLQGWRGGRYSDFLIFGLLPMFGFFLGLLVALWRKERGL